MSPLSRNRRASFARAEDGSIAIEFAVIVPILVILLLGTFEISKYIQTNNQVVQSVAMIGQMVSQLPAAATVEDAQRIWGAAPLIAPEAYRAAQRQGKSAWTDVLDVAITNVVFTKKIPTCTSACEYDAKVAWSIGKAPKACGTLPQTKAGAGFSANAVPEELYGNGSAILVRAAFRYDPYVIGSSGVLGPVAQRLTTTIDEAGWFQPRNTDRVVLAAPARSETAYTLCPEVNR